MYQSAPASSQVRNEKSFLLVMCYSFLSFSFRYRCARNIETIFSLPYFIQVITSGLVLGFIVFQLATVSAKQSYLQLGKEQL